MKCLKKFKLLLKYSLTRNELNMARLYMMTSASKEEKFKYIHQNITVKLNIKRRLFNL